MGNEEIEAVDIVLFPSNIKVHRFMCTKLLNLVDRISEIFPAIEAARPRCSSGIQALCSLNRATEKAKLLVQYCSESSKLYLAITGDVIMSRCDRSRNLLNQSLTQIHNMVPITLALEISLIIEDLRNATFALDSSEEETGNVVRALLHSNTPLSATVENSVINSLQFAAMTLHITTSKALLIEKRSVKKLLDKFSDNETKRKILSYLLYLLKKYGQFMIGEQKENFAHQDLSNNSQHAASRVAESRVGRGHEHVQTNCLSTSAPPPEYKCTLSMKVMYDPMVISSGQTFERIWIQKWFDEGHDTCPNTKKKLSNFSLTPNSAMKDLISKWCNEHGLTISDPSIQQVPSKVHSWENESSSASMLSFGSSMNDILLPVDFSNVSLGFSDTSYTRSDVKTPDIFSFVSRQTNDHSQRCQAYSDTHDEKRPNFLFELNSLPWDEQKRVVENVKDYLNYNDQAFQFITSENMVEPIIRFLKKSYELRDSKCQKVGSQLLLTIMNKSRDDVPCLHDDVSNLLASLLVLDVTDESLAIMVLLCSHHSYFRSKIAASGVLISITQTLNSQTKEYQELAIKLIYDMSSNSDTRFYIGSFKCIPKLVPFLSSENSLSKYIILILKNLCDSEEARVTIVETSGCIASIAELLDTGTCEDQEHAVYVLLSLCSQRVQYCQLVMDEGVIPALCSISVNGNEKGKIGAMELLRLLRDMKYSSDIQESFAFVPVPEESRDFIKETKVSSKPSSGFFGRKLSLFTKSTPKKKK